MEYLNLVVAFMLQGIHLSHSFNITISGDTYIVPGDPYKVTCTVSDAIEKRKTTYTAILSMENVIEFSIFDRGTGGCMHGSANALLLCQSSICSCDMDDFSTHWTYSTPTDWSSLIIFRCTSKNNAGSLITSNHIIPTISNGPESSISFSPTDESITKNLSESLGPIACSAQCIPQCEFHWIKPDGSVVDGSNLEILSLSKNDHGIFTCHAGNGYGNNATTSLQLTVNYGPQSVTLVPSTMTYNVTEGDNIPPISCTASCRPECTFMWTGPNVHDGTTKDLKLQNINRDQKGTFYCTATNEVGSKVSSNVEVDVQYGPGSSISLNPVDESITKVLGQRLGPIVCSAQCSPPCKFHWIKPNGTVVVGSNLTISSLSKNDQGTFTCQAGNGYGSNGTQNLNITVNYGAEYVTLSPSTTTYNVTEGDTIPSINCTATCRPQCTFMWTGPNVPDDTTNDLYLHNINRNQKGTFYCNATNKVGSKVSPNVEVDVRYGPESVILSPPNTTYTVTQGDTIPSISCTASCRPQCTFMWIGPNVPGDTTNDLYLHNINRNQKGTFYCNATNEVDSKVSSIVEVDVRYGPGSSVSLNPADQSITKILGQGVGPIVCSAQCNPRCQFHWLRPGGTVINGSNLTIPSLSKNDHGTFTCHTGNDYGNNATKNLNVTVNYEAKVENVTMNTTNTVEENSTVIFSCLLEGNPAPTVTWSLNGKILQTKERSTAKSCFIVDSARCNNTGKYICTASNIIGNSTKQLMLNVTCHPRNAIILDTTIAIKDKNATLNITVPIISYPQPTLIRWTFIQNGTTTLIDVDNKYITTTYGVYQHVSQLIKDGLIESEYGTYSINVTNNIGPYFQHDFMVVAETIPDPPSNVSAVCDTSPFSTIISWRSEFDGGRAQTFHVWFEICCENVHKFVAYSENKSDPGRNKYVSVEITSLQAATPYIFYVSSSNDYGSSSSTNVFCNTTTKSTRTDPNSAVIGIAAGVSSAIVVLIVVVVIVIIRRRFASDNGLKDNILYESAGPDFDRKQTSNGDEYAVVKKKGNTFHANDNGTIQVTALHAEDKKKPKLGKKGQLDSNTRQANGKDGMNEYKHENVYEIIEDKVGNERSTCQPMDNRNKDGLLYADLMFNPSPNGANFVIHGMEERTIYADVDTTQKIDPLLDSDVEDDQNNSKSNKTAE